MSDFVRACRVADVAPESAIPVEIGGTELAIVQSDGHFYAIADECSHAVHSAVRRGCRRRGDRVLSARVALRSAHRPADRAPGHRAGGDLSVPSGG